MSVVVTALLLTLPWMHAAEQSAQRACQDGVYTALDFWIGTWEVHLAGPAVPRDPAQPDLLKRAGSNVIEKTLGGCAILEHWTDVFGSEGKSLFYYHRSANAWKQVWVTDVGRVKEKRMIDAPSGAVRFQGEVRLDNGTRILDRTTLTPLSADRVRQHIEQSTDDGKTWQSTFDAIYTRHAAPRKKN